MSIIWANKLMVERSNTAWAWAQHKYSTLRQYIRHNLIILPWCSKRSATSFRFPIFALNFLFIFVFHRVEEYVSHVILSLGQLKWPINYNKIVYKMIYQLFNSIKSNWPIISSTRTKSPLFIHRTMPQIEKHW